MTDDRLAVIKERLAQAGVLWYDDGCYEDMEWLVGEVERLRKELGR